MSTEVFTALVTGPITALVTAVLTYLFSSDRSRLSKVGGDRRHALAGTWKGQLHHHLRLPNIPEVSEVELTLRPGIRTVRGDGCNSFRGDGREYESRFQLRGGFMFDRFLKLDYLNKKDSVVQFGAVILELHDNGQELQGRLAGYGSFSRQVISASISLVKTD